MKFPEAKQIGVVFSGGGVRGMAHIGALKALREHEIHPHWISGSSSGALVGALYAKGMGIEEMLSFFKETPLFRYNVFSFSKPGFLDTERYVDLFQKIFPENSFESLEKPLYVAATNLLKGKEVYFSEGELIRPLLASAALPPIFSPVSIEGELYADGGIMNNFPLEPIKEQAAFLIGSNVSVVKNVTREDMSSAYRLVNRTTSLMHFVNTRDKIGKCDLVFQPRDLEKIGVLDKNGIEKAFTIGYDNAQQVLKKHRA
ncbi:patatin-like phospholipase family protein [Robiginitalea sp. IMCC44478]|uniref:patatin-like phospholipase family protein n=1 Tax=Robiginitalea sp. IMCC44478 TaxID=3459122 RepID=UPI004042242F